MKKLLSKQQVRSVLYPFLRSSWVYIRSSQTVSGQGCRGGVKRLALVQRGRDTTVFAKIKRLLPVSAEPTHRHLDLDGCLNEHTVILHQINVPLSAGCRVKSMTPSMELMIRNVLQ